MFNRWQRDWPNSWPFVVFKKHHAQLNHFYWSGVAAGAFARNGFAALPPAQTLDTAVAIAPSNARRINYTSAEWAGHFVDAENWTRLAALVSMTGYFETFMHAIVTLALTSDPGVLISSPRAADGVGLLKKGASVDLRAHQAEPLQTLSETQLQDWLRLIDECATAVEEHLKGAHICAGEVLLHYHYWDKRYDMGATNEQQAFARMFASLDGNRLPREYFRGAIAYYKAL